MQGFRQKSVPIDFGLTPRPDIPRSKFSMPHAVKFPMDAGYLNPCFCELVLPGETWNVGATFFGRLATPIFPVMDNLHVESFFFFVPLRIIWDNFVKFMGQQTNPGDSISYSVPQQTSPVGGYNVGSLEDLFGLPTVGQVGGASQVTHSCLPIRAYMTIYNEWFRDENLINTEPVNKNDGPDSVWNGAPKRRGKRYDYFTGCLPWPQKGVASPLAIGGTAPVLGIGLVGANPAHGNVANVRYTDGSSSTQDIMNPDWSVSGQTNLRVKDISGTIYPNIVADLSSATGATINALRQAFQIQKLLERDARGGTRYAEITRSHFGVINPDPQWRPSYLGGGSTPLQMHPVAQTSVTAATPLGTLSAFGQVIANHGFSGTFTEHGYIIGLVNVRADLTYQQGLRRHWSYLTRYDFPWPVFSGLGEQAVLSKEIYCTGAAADNDVFGYRPRFDELRYIPSQINGLFRSTAAGTLDPWHLSQKFTARPTLNETFINDTPPLDRVLAVTSTGKQLLMDAYFDVKATRPIPAYGVPGLIDHF